MPASVFKMHTYCTLNPNVFLGSLYISRNAASLYIEITLHLVYFLLQLTFSSFLVLYLTSPL